MLKRQPACQPLASAQCRRSACDNSLRSFSTILAGIGNCASNSIRTNRNPCPRVGSSCLRILTQQAKGSANRCQGPRTSSFPLATSSLVCSFAPRQTVLQHGPRDKPPTSTLAQTSRTRPRQPRSGAQGRSHGREPAVVHVGLPQPADTGGKGNRNKHLWVLACAHAAFVTKPATQPKKASAREEQRL